MSLLARLGVAAALWAAACGPERAPAPPEARAAEGGADPAARSAPPFPLPALGGDVLAQEWRGFSDEELAALVERISEPGGYFDTDNLISNETGYLNVMDALDRLGVRGGVYVGVGPGQSFSYVARVRPVVAFITDVRRDNLLHHLLLKALIERAPTRVEFLAGLHGRVPPEEPEAWRARDLEDIVEYIDRTPADRAVVAALADEIDGSLSAYGVPLSDEDRATVRRFHRAFVEAGLGLRFTSHGRAPMPYYPTYRQLLLETDADGDRASWLASPEAYDTVRRMQLANRIVPVVGDMAGPSAVREIAEVVREMGLELTAFYTSNVEFYLWRARTFDAWRENLAAFPLADEAVVIRSYFPDAGAPHPSRIAGYYATQTLQPARVLLEGRFSSYRDVVTRGVVDLQDTG